MAAVGCSLMEAYNVPSFDPPRRRKGCVVDTNDIKASSEPYDPFIDPRRDPGTHAAVPGRPQVPSGRTQEGFESMGPTLPKYYSGYTQDRKYYCDAYNICPKTTEGFQGSAASSAPYPPAPPSHSQSAAAAPPQMASGAPAPRRAQKTCSGPLMAPNYEYPMTEEALQQYNKAIQLSISQPQGGADYEPPPPLPPAKGDILGYTDEDLDQFLKTQEMKSVPFDLPKVPKDDREVPGRDPQATPFAETMKTLMDAPPATASASGSSESSTASGSSTAAPHDPWEKVWDIALFVVAGLLIILLLDQLFKLAMLYGMKRAFLAIEPLLERALP